MTSLVERVARALCEANFAAKGAEGEFGTVDDCWFAFTDAAQAAIAAIPDAARITKLEEALGYIVRADGKSGGEFIDWQRCVDRIQEVARVALQGETAHKEE